MRPGLRVVLLACFLMVLTPAAVARAANNWCDTDPLVIIQTPAGNYVPVYIMVGADSTTYTPDTLLSMSQISYTVTPTKKAGTTQVNLTVTVPTYLANSPFNTRVAASTGPWGTLYLYSLVYGTSGHQMTAAFSVPYP